MRKVQSALRKRSGGARQLGSDAYWFYEYAYADNTICKVRSRVESVH